MGAQPCAQCRGVARARGGPGCRHKSRNGVAAKAALGGTPFAPNTASPTNALAAVKQHGLAPPSTMSFASAWQKAASESTFTTRLEIYGSEQMQTWS